MTGLGDGELEQGVGARAPTLRVPSKRGAPEDEPKLHTLEDVYRTHAGFVWRVVRRFGIPEGSVEDVMHEVFLVVHRRLDEYDGRASMTTWLYSIARGVASNHRRGRAREERRIRLVSPEPSGVVDPQRATEETEAADFVRTFVATLDAEKRQVFELVDLEGLPVPQVAEECGIKLNTAYSRLRAARKSFQDAVDRRHKTESRNAGRIA